MSSWTERGGSELSLAKIIQAAEKKGGCLAVTSANTVPEVNGNEGFDEKPDNLNL